MSAENKEVSRRFTELFNSDDLSAVEEVFTPDFTFHLASGNVEGIEQMKGFIAAYRNAFPDAHSTVDRQVAEDDIVVTLWTARGTHLGAFMGIQPTGRRFEISGVTTEKVEGGRISEVWVTRDELGMMQQLGLIPQPQLA
jgi:steroid delta-isomerase-like uncharacterized protein